MDPELRDQTGSSPRCLPWAYSENAIKLTSGLKKAHKKGFDTILQLFQQCNIYRESQLASGSDEELCRRLDIVALEDHSHVSTHGQGEKEIGHQHYIFKDKLVQCDAVRTLNRLRREAGDENPRIHTSKQVRQRARHPFTRTDVDVCSSTG